MAERTKLTLMINFKQKTMSNDKFPIGMYVTVPEKGWMDESLMHKWIKNVWKCGIANAMDGSQDNCLFEDLVKSLSQGERSEDTEAEIFDNFERELNYYYDDQTESGAWNILCTGDSDSEFDGFTDI